MLLSSISVQFMLGFSSIEVLAGQLMKTTGMLVDLRIWFLQLQQQLQWWFYEASHLSTTGVYNDLTCTKNVSHAVLAVGYGDCRAGLLAGETQVQSERL